MRIGLDLDGVVANFTAGWMRFYNEQFGTSLQVADSTDWGDLVNLTHFGDIDEFWKWSSDLDGHSVFWHLDPFPGAVEAVQDLADAGHEIIVLTTKPEFAVEDAHDWISRHDLPAREIHILEDKWRVPCEVYLDDGPHILPALVARRPEAKVCRYVRPWNVPVDGAVDVTNFEEFQQVVDQMADNS